MNKTKAVVSFMYGHFSEANKGHACTCNLPLSIRSFCASAHTFRIIYIYYLLNVIKKNNCNDNAVVVKSI